MLSAVYGPSAAAPLVSLSLVHIARTPKARLGIAYHLVPTFSFESARVRHRQRFVQPNGFDQADFLGGVAQRDGGIRLWYDVPLGTGLYLDSLLGGGIDGQPLTMSMSANYAASAGTALDVQA